MGLGLPGLRCCVWIRQLFRDAGHAKEIDGAGRITTAVSVVVRPCLDVRIRVLGLRVVNIRRSLRDGLLFLRNRLLSRLRLLLLYRWLLLYCCLRLGLNWLGLLLNRLLLLLHRLLLLRLRLLWRGLDMQ